MKKIISKLLVLLLTLTVAFSLTSCDIAFAILDAFLEAEGTLPDLPDGSTTDDDTGSGTGNGGSTTDKEDQKVEIKPDDNQQFDPENPYSGLQSGYNIKSNVVDDTEYKVSSYYEADRIIDMAIMNHYAEVVIDFTPMGNAYSVDDLSSVGEREMGHTSIKFSHYPSKPEVVTFLISYDHDTASYILPLTDDNTYHNYKNGNMLIRDYLDGESTRAADFDDFAINKNNAGEMKVYNSEELWWALEHNYLPIFPMENSKAEAFYNEAKNILRQIINDDMTEYEKTLAIFEYLVDMVYYDYDAYNAIGGDNTSANACYYLEGVFEYNRAVCDGKSKAFVLLCRIEGIECVRDWGSAVNGGVGHAWNYVKIDGTWYMVDTTAGDGGTPLPDVKIELVNYDFFLCPVNTYKENSGYDDSEYNYSGIWDSLLGDNNNDETMTDVYMDYDVNADKVDFVIEDFEELELLVEYMFEAEANWNYVLRIQVSGDIKLGNAAADIEDLYTNVECSAYSGDSGAFFVFTILPIIE